MPSGSDLARFVDRLVEASLSLSKSSNGRYRCEDIISSAAAFAGECQMRLAGDFDIDNHSFTPGQAVFSQRIGELLYGDCTDWEKIPATSAFGAVFNVLTHNPKAPWAPEEFPRVDKLLAEYAASKNRSTANAQWGFIRLSLNQEHWPKLPPLRSAFELRQAVSTVPGFSSLSKTEVATVSLLALIRMLMQLREHIDGQVALTLALETLNGIAKTAPVLPKHIAQFAKGNRLTLD